MKSVLDFLCGILMTMFWIFRIVIAALITLEIEIPISIQYLNIEIFILFVTLLCIILVFKGKSFGGILYFIMYIGYYGYDLVNIVNTNSISINGLSVIIDFFAIFIAVFAIFNIMINKVTGMSKKSNTEWFYKNKDYDRKLDERADKNKYKFY